MRAHVRSIHINNNEKNYKIMEEKRKLALFLNSVEGAKSSKDYAKKEQELFVLCIKSEGYEPKENYGFDFGLVECEGTNRVVELGWKLLEEYSSDVEKYTELVIFFHYKYNISKLRRKRSVQLAYKDLFFRAITGGEEFFQDNGWEHFSTTLYKILGVTVTQKRKHLREVLHIVYA